MKHFDESIRKRRVALLGLIFFACALLVLSRVIYLQVWRSVALEERSRRNLCSTETVPPKRGRLLDCFGRELATNRDVYSLSWRGAGKRSLSQETLNAISAIEEIVGSSFDRKAVGRAERRRLKLTLASDLNLDDVCKISERISAFEQFEVSSVSQRYYPHGSLASHILGYLGRADFVAPPVGRSGLESILQEALGGQGGFVEHMVNARGERLSLMNLLQPQAGQDVRLTLDLELQSFAEGLLGPDESGAFLLLDPENGSLRVVASYPSFDPNRFLSGISSSEWDQDFKRGFPLLNRAFCATYPPASIFKLVTFASALEMGVIDRETRVDCKGFYLFGGRKYFCIRAWGHGELEAHKALAVSCNAFCYDIGLRVGIDSLAYCARRFGLGVETGVLMPEKPGLVPSSAWKQGFKGEPWWKGETLSASIGQSYLLATPLQLARMLGAIFTGYLVRPRILEDEPIDKMPLSISEETLEFLREAMAGVTEHGTAALLGKVPGVEVFAKTGTAQTSNVRRGVKTYEQKEHAWCTAFFRVKGQPPLVAVALVEHAGRSEPAVVAVEKCLRLLAARKK